jgi:hypothetical protein
LTPIWNIGVAADATPCGLDYFPATEGQEQVASRSRFHSYVFDGLNASSWCTAIEVERLDCKIK